VKVVRLASDVAERDEIISKLQTEPPVLLIGSAISAFAPSCLPSGKRFKDQLFELLFPTTFFEDMPPMRAILQEHYENVPFEHVLEKIPPYESIRPMINKAYNAKIYNSIHEVLARALLAGRIKHIITTNYDLGLETALDQIMSEKAFSPDKLPTLVFLKEHAERAVEKKKPIYFKIHGTADNRTGESIIYALRGEGSLPRWKRALLQQMLEEETLLLIGYSGVDFEICPEISNMATKRVVWNGRDDADKASHNARSIFDRDNGYYVQGDMRELIPRLFPAVPLATKNESNELLEKIKNAEMSESDDLFNEIKRSFSPGRVAEWRTRLLASLHCSSLAIKSADELLRVTDHLDYDLTDMRVQKAWALMQSGKLRDSIKLYNSTIEFRTVQECPYALASLLITLSDVYRCRGQYWRACSTLKKALEPLKDVPKRDERKELMFMALTKEGNILKDLYLILKGIPIPIIKGRIRRRMGKVYKKAARPSLEAGNWGYLNEIRLRAEQVGLNVENLFKDLPFEPPPASMAYDHIAIISGASMSARLKVGEGKGSLSDEEKALLFHHLNLCESFEVHPEVWLICLLVLRREGLWKFITKWSLFRKFAKAFFSCQYSLPMRLAVPFFKGRL